jgi:hypothetical protein
MIKMGFKQMALVFVWVMMVPKNGINGVTMKALLLRVG